MPEPEGTGGPAPQRQHNEDRMRRAYAWIERSRQEGTENIERFMFLWIAFNAAYGNEAALREFVEGEEGRESESHRFRAFLGNIVKKDGSGVLERIVWDEFSGPIRILLLNRYVFRPVLVCSSCQGMHPLQVPRQAHQGPLAAGHVQASQVKAPEAHHLLDHPEYRFHGRLAPGIDGARGPRCDRQPKRQR